jgi:hypothetical protein
MLLTCLTHAIGMTSLANTGAIDALPALAPFQSNEGPPHVASAANGSEGPQRVTSSVTGSNVPPKGEAFGSWADPDMLPLGRIGHPDPRDPYHPQRQSNLTSCTVVVVGHDFRLNNAVNIIQISRSTMLLITILLGFTVRPLGSILG